MGFNKSLDGVAICPFIYDRISYIGAHLYKAGIYVSEDYLNTKSRIYRYKNDIQFLMRMVISYAIETKGYNYISRGA